jgi:hypothetical protein
MATGGWKNTSLRTKDKYKKMSKTKKQKKEWGQVWRRKSDYSGHNHLV